MQTFQQIGTDSWIMNIFFLQGLSLSIGVYREHSTCVSVIEMHAIYCMASHRYGISKTALSITTNQWYTTIEQNYNDCDDNSIASPATGAGGSTRIHMQTRN